MPNTLLPEKWSTRQLVVSDSVQVDIPAIQEVCDSCSYINQWTGWKPEDHPGMTMETVLRDGELPPDGSKQFFRLQTIRISGIDEVIGFLEFYHGFPQEDIFWLLYLYIRPQLQGKGYGQEIVSELCALVNELNYSSIRLVVALKNWTALRFWVKNGFNRIIEMHGDPVFSASSFADFILEKRLVE